jgi:hypothetical protein
MYLIVFTKLDIAFAIGKLSQYISKPIEYYGHTLKGLIRYLKSTIS